MNSTQDAIAFIAVSLLPCLLGIVFFVMYLLSTRRALVERGQKEYYRQLITAYINGRKEIFTRVSVYEGFIIIRYTELIVLYGQDIEYVEVTGNFLNRGLQILHHDFRMPQRIKLILANPEHLKAMIEKHLHLSDKPGYGPPPKRTVQVVRRKIELPTFPPER